MHVTRRGVSLFDKFVSTEFCTAEPDRLGGADKVWGREAEKRSDFSCFGIASAGSGPDFVSAVRKPINPRSKMSSL